MKSIYKPMIQKISRLAALTIVLSLMASCNEQETQDDVVKSISKNGSVETVVSVEHGDSADILVTRHKVWVLNALAKEFVTRDTIPALGDTIITVNKNGNDIQQAVQKDYEFYITVQ